jgi:transcriptional regulator with XRE-family HTH domain
MDGAVTATDPFAPVSTPDSRPRTGLPTELGPLLAHLRTERGLAQKEAAHLADIDGSTLSRLESGDRGVSREVLERLCAVLDLDRREQLAVLYAAGFLTEEAARILADDDLVRVARLLTDPSISAEDAADLRQYLRLALAYAKARGYAVD